MKRPFLIMFLAAGIVCAYPGELKKLSFGQVFQKEGEKLTRDLPKIEEWLDNEYYYQVEDDKTFKVHGRSGRARLILEPADYTRVLGNEGFDLLEDADRTKDLNQFLFIKDKDIFLYLRKEKRLTQITDTKEEEKNPTFSPDGKGLAYTRAGNLYVCEIASQQTSRLTEDGSEEILNGCASWVYYEEILGRRGKYRAFWWSPDSKKIVFLRFDQSQVPIFPIVNVVGSYGELEEQRYPKAGFPNPQVRIGIVDLEKKDLQWLPVSGKQDHYLTFLAWNAGSDKLYFQWMNRDQNHQKILVYDLVNKEIHQVYEEKQRAWVEFFDSQDFYLLKNDDIIVRSSRDGWYHLYHITADGQETQVTSGDWSVTAIECVDQGEKIIYFSAQKEDSTETDFYKTDFLGDRIQKLTLFRGTHRLTVSPTGKYFVDEYSSVNTPTRLELRDHKGRLVRKIADSYSPVIKDYNLAPLELFRIPTTDGYRLPALWFLPPGFDKNSKYPLVFSIYGGPGSRSVTNSWPRLRYRFLAQHGIIVMVVDHRGSGHFGKKGMDLMHRSLGRWELHDYIEVVKYLRQMPFVDGERIGITGGSYGGYVAALALSKGSDYFKYGIAGASVIDWQLYDSVYTERYMDTPQQNPAGYQESSVLSYVDRYRSGTLRIDHGTMDDNVHMQNTLQFVDKVLEAGKSLELMLYPGQRHGYRGKKRWDSERADIDFWLRKFFGKEFKYEFNSKEHK